MNDKKTNNILETLNPIPPGNEGLAMIREHSPCMLTPEATKVQSLLKKIIVDKKLIKNNEDLIKDSLFLGVSGRLFCDEQLTKRLICKFEDDDVLMGLQDELNEYDNTMETLVEKMKELELKARTALKKRYEHILSHYGLDPKKEFYCIDDKEKRVDTLKLNCDECKNAKKLSSIRQKMDDLQLRLNTLTGANND